MPSFQISFRWSFIKRLSAEIKKMNLKFNKRQLKAKILTYKIINLKKKMIINNFVC